MPDLCLREYGRAGARLWTRVEECLLTRPIVRMLTLTDYAFKNGWASNWKLCTVKWSLAHLYSKLQGPILPWQLPSPKPCPSSARPFAVCMHQITKTPEHQLYPSSALERRRKHKEGGVQRCMHERTIQMQAINTRRLILLESLVFSRGGLDRGYGRGSGGRSCILKRPIVQTLTLTDYTFSSGWASNC